MVTDGGTFGLRFLEDQHRGVQLGQVDGQVDWLGAQGAWPRGS